MYNFQTRSLFRLVVVIVFGCSECERILKSLKIDDIKKLKSCQMRAQHTNKNNVQFCYSLVYY
jgi:hypothetical protein